MATYPKSVGIINDVNLAAQWVCKERARLANLERKCLDILDGRDNELLTLRVQNRALKKELAKAREQLRREH